jgi:hypothetical protein
MLQHSSKCSSLVAQDKGATAVVTGVAGATAPYLRAKVAELCELCIQLQRFVDRNATLLRQVASRADAEEIVFGATSCTNHVNRRLSVSPVRKNIFGPTHFL